MTAARNPKDSDINKQRNREPGVVRGQQRRWEMTRTIALFLACMFAVSLMGCSAHDHAVDSFLQGQ
jgi:hypothetical protein